MPKDNNEPFFQRLTRLFRSGPAIQRRTKGIDPKNYYGSQLIRGNYGYRSSAPFGFGRENSPFSALGAYGILDRMSRYCLSGDTLIPTNTKKGFITMKALAEVYKDPDHKKIHTFSYDHESKKIVLSEITNAFYTKEDFLVEVYLDRKNKVRCTKDHRFMLRDGSYRQAQDLKPGDSLMPFYRKELKKYKNGNDYRVIYDLNKWTGEHKIVAEYSYSKEILPEENLYVHHKDFCGINNEIENLVLMPAKEHLAYHASLGLRKSDHIALKHHERMKAGITIPKVRRRAEKRVVRFPKCVKPGFSNQNVDQSFTIQAIIAAWEPDVTVEQLCKKCGVHRGKFYSRLKWAGYENYVDFVRKNFDKKYYNRYTKRPRTQFTDQLPDIQKVYTTYRHGEDTATKLANKLNIPPETLTSILQRSGYISWHDFKSKYKNHKVFKVVKTDIKEKVYDLTIDKYHNFATQAGVIVHNSEFSEMDYTPELATAMDIYSDEVVGGDDKGKSFHIYSENEQIKNALDELFYDVLNVEFNLKPWVRNLVKYGDFFLFNEVLPDIGVINVFPIPVSEVEREDGFDPVDPYATRFKWITRGNKYLENWQVSHFRLLSNDLFLPYGTSILESARRSWRQLTMLEDAMLTYRVVRSPERRVFYIDVASVPPNDVDSYMEAVKSTLRTQTHTDRQTGREDLRYNAQSMLDDYFIPIRGDKQGTKIDTLSGGVHVSATEDVEYIQKKLFAAVKVPKPYLNFDENLSAKASLAQMDIRFSRTIGGIQKVMIAELNKLAMIHLFVKGFDGADLINFELKLSSPSSVAIQQKLELMSVKFDTAGTAKDTGLVDERWIQKNILELTPTEIEGIESGLRRDKIKEKELDDLELTPMDPSAPPKTTDIFDVSNYDSPASNVPKTPMPDDKFDTPEKKRSPLVSKNDPVDVNPFSVELDNASVPVKSTPFINRHRKNRSRRVGQSTGRQATAMPDFNAMLSPKNKYTKDVYGLKTESPEGIRSLKDLHNDFEKEIKKSGYIQIEPKLGGRMSSVFKGIEEHFGKSLNKNKLLNESINLDDLEEIEIEQVGDKLLLEFIEPKKKNEKLSKDDDIELIKEKSLSDIYNPEEE